jgi:MoaA/NifB/PqqE/SkfB family radical SAM enzyme
VTEPSSTCRSPHVALRFSPDGRVHACCVNESYQLGRIGERSIREVWEGAELARLRTALDAADFALGCQDCGMLHATGHREHTQAAAFDRFPQPDGPSWPRRLEFALSNTCNLRCVQCSGDLSSAIRAQREHRPPLRSPYDDAFFEELRDFLPHLEVAVFIGGEPFLSRECRRVWDLLIEMDLHPEVHVTTNATVWDDRVEHYVRSLAMNVCVSVDGATPEVNDAIRLGSDLREVRVIRDRFRSLTRELDRVFGINHCLMVQNWHELGAVLLEAEGLEAEVNVIPVLYPPAHSVVCQPRDEVVTVLDALLAQEPDVRPHLERNGSAWDGVISQLHTIVDGAEAPVHLGARPALGQRDDDLLADVEEELRSWAGRRP